MPLRFAFNPVIDTYALAAGRVGNHPLTAQQYCVRVDVAHATFCQYSALHRLPACHRNGILSSDMAY